MTYRRGATVFGFIVFVSLIGSEVGALSNTRFGTVVWLAGLVILAVVSPCFGYCLGRVSSGRGHLPMKLFK